MSIRGAVTSENMANGNFLSSFKSGEKQRASANQRRSCVVQSVLGEVASYKNFYLWKSSGALGGISV